MLAWLGLFHLPIIKFMKIIHISNHKNHLKKYQILKNKFCLKYQNIKSFLS